jgi:MFS transporter, putative metabolite:H+ symporter
MSSSTSADYQITARIERLPLSTWHLKILVPIGTGWFFDAFDALSIAYVLPVLIGLWHLAPSQIGLLIALGYAGQVIGSIFFGSLAERIGRVPCTIYTLIIFSVMSFACAFAWDYSSLLAMRFVQGIGLGGEIPIMATYIGEFAAAKRRGRFALGYQMLFTIGLLFTGLVGAFMVPTFGWQAMFIIGALPALIALPLRWLLPESPRWLASRGRFAEADKVLSKIESEISRGGNNPLPPIPAGVPAVKPAETRFKQLISGIYLRRSLTVWAIWFCSYSVIYGLSTWVPSIFRTVYHFDVAQSNQMGFLLSSFGVVGALVAVTAIDVVGRKPLFVAGQLLSAIPLLILAFSPNLAVSSVQVLVIASFFFITWLAISLSTYTAELYPTEMRALGCGVGNAWLRGASVLGPYMVGWILSTGGGINIVFLMFGAFALVGAIVTIVFAVETRGRVLEELSPSASA